MKKALLILGIIFILIQFIPVDRSNPPVKAEPNWDSPETRELFMRACGDCHSHNTKWPWYSYIAPISWLIAYDVKEGREHFNVSMWGYQKKNKADEAVEEILEGEMPPFLYTLMHPEARLSPTEKKKLIEGLKRTFGIEED
ncbi:MAG: heme-binding domain-containing protein [Epsilonproteobacteria bacterium]|nr:heme-binding domain-containing protein [Campylobacterota bacterium]